MELITSKFNDQCEVFESIQLELLNLSKMEDEALVDEIEHLIELVPNIGFEYDVLPVIFRFHNPNNPKVLTKDDRELLIGSYILGHLNVGLDEEGYVAKVEV